MLSNSLCIFTIAFVLLLSSTTIRGDENDDNNNECCLCQNCETPKNSNFIIYNNDDLTSCSTLASKMIQQRIDHNEESDYEEHSTCKAYQNQHRLICCEQTEFPILQISNTNNVADEEYTTSSIKRKDGNLRASSNTRQLSTCTLCRDGSFPKNPTKGVIIEHLTYSFEGSCRALFDDVLKLDSNAQICKPIQAFLDWECGCNENWQGQTIPEMGVWSVQGDSIDCTTTSSCGDGATTSTTTTTTTGGSYSAQWSSGYKSETSTSTTGETESKETAWKSQEETSTTSNGETETYSSYNSKSTGISNIPGTWSENGSTVNIENGKSPTGIDYNDAAYGPNNGGGTTSITTNNNNSNNVVNPPPPPMSTTSTTETTSKEFNFAWENPQDTTGETTGTTTNDYANRPDWGKTWTLTLTKDGNN